MIYPVAFYFHGGEDHFFSTPNLNAPYHHRHPDTRLLVPAPCPREPQSISLRLPSAFLSRTFTVTFLHFPRRRPNFDTRPNRLRCKVGMRKINFELGALLSLRDPRRGA
jgi:hypothetical protein